MHLPLTLAALCILCGLAFATEPTSRPSVEDSLVIDYSTPTDPALQAALVKIDADLRAKYNIPEDQTDVGLLDLLTGRLAMIHPDHEEYAASVAKIGILLAYFDTHPEAATQLDPGTRHDLGLMAKISSDAMATKFSTQLGLKNIQHILSDKYHFYDASKGGGLWVGKHYAKGTERYGDPVCDHSHAATVRQLLRYWLLLDQHKLVSPQASQTMLDIFDSPDIPHDDIKFVKGLAGRPVHILRKWGSWEDWLHDTALITGPGRRYILVAMTHNAAGDSYLEGLAPAVDDLMSPAAR